MFRFTFLFPPGFSFGEDCHLLRGGGASWDGWWLREPGPSGPCKRIGFPSLGSFSSPLPLRGAGRAKQRKELTRKEEAGGLRILGAPLPLPPGPARRGKSRTEAWQAHGTLREV